MKMRIQIIKQSASLACAVFIIMMLALPVMAVNYSAGGNSGGRIGENYNAPAANGGGEGSANGSRDPGAGGAVNGNDNIDGVYADTTEDGEVLGVSDTENSATVGIVIAILIAIAVVVLIIALLPRGASST